MHDADLSTTDFERAYDLLAAALDRVGPQHESAFLARLALLLMHAAPEQGAIADAIRAAEAAPD